VVGVTEWGIYYITVFTLTLVKAVAYHELGHILYYRWVTGKWPKVWFERGAINVGTDVQVRRLKPKQRRVWYLTGIIAGFIALISCPVWWIGLVCFVPYFMGCRWDIARICE